MSNLEGKIAVVTGAAQGIGRDIALTLAQNGCNLAICDKDFEKLETVVKEVESQKRICIGFSVNVANLAEVENMVVKILDKFNRIDILVNNAGITKDNLILRMSEEEWDAVLDVNLKGTFNFIKAVAKYMVKQREGRIVNIASVVGITGNAGQANYSSSKAGVIGLTKSIAKELASRNITVNAVAPGFIKTAMTEKLPEAVKNAMLDRIPLKRFGEARDIANGVLFFVSNESSYITGQVLTIDGGMIMST